MKLFFSYYDQIDSLLETTHGLRQRQGCQDLEMATEQQVKLYRNENDYLTAFNNHISGSHKVLDEILYGVVESYKSGYSKGSSVVALHPKPVEALADRLTGTETLMTVAVKHSYRIPLDGLVSLAERILLVQESTPTKDLKTLTNKSHLVSLHATAWNFVVLLMGRATPSLVASVMSSSLGELTKTFLCRYHVPLTEHEALLSSLVQVISLVSEADDSLLASMLVKTNALKTLLEVCNETLKSHSKNVNSTQTESNHAITKSLKLPQKRQAEDNSKGLVVSEDLLTKVLICLKNLFAASSIQVTLGLSQRESMAEGIVQLIGHSATSVIIQVHALSALASLVINQQPAFLSPLLPLLIRVTSITINSKSHELQVCSKEISSKIDCLIRPRRSLPPGPSKPPSVIPQDLPMVESQIPTKTLPIISVPSIVTQPSTSLNVPRTEATTISNNDTNLPAASLKTSLYEPLSSQLSPQEPFTPPASTIPIPSTITPKPSSMNSLLMESMMKDVGDGDGEDAPLPMIIDDDPDE